MTVERDPRATTAQQCSKGLILLKKQTAYLSKALILHAHEIGTFCIDCTGTPSRVPGGRGGQERSDVRATIYASTPTRSKSAVSSYAIGISS
jgi:hypothetical protein